MKDFKTRLYFANVKDLDYHRAYSMVCEARRQKADRLMLFDDKLMCVGAELLLRRALLDFGVNTYSISYTKSQKPYLINSDICFNISHSEYMVACAVSALDVGCDIEKIAPKDIKIAKRFLSDEEYSVLSRQTEATVQNDMFISIWSKKEAYAKATGKGLSATAKLPFDSRYYFKEYNIPKYKCFLCSLYKEFEDEPFKISSKELCALN